MLIPLNVLFNYVSPLCYDFSTKTQVSSWVYTTVNNFLFVLTYDKLLLVTEPQCHFGHGVSKQEE